MAKIALPAISETEEIDADTLNDALLHGARHMPSLSTKKIGSRNESGRDTAARPVKADPGLQRMTKAISLPKYVWDWIKSEHRSKDEPQNVVMMRLMMQGGAPIRREDLVDGRMKRS